MRDRRVATKPPAANPCNLADGGAGLKFKQVTDSPYSGDGSVLDGYEASLSRFEAGPPFQPFPARVVEQRTVGLFEYATSSPATSNEMLMQPTSNVQYVQEQRGRAKRA